MGLWEKKVRLLQWGEHPSRPNYVRLTPNPGFGFAFHKKNKYYRVAVSARRGIELFVFGKIARRTPDGWRRVKAWLSPMKPAPPERR